MKKYISLFLILVLVLSFFTACSGDSGSESTTTPVSDNKITVTIDADVFTADFPLNELEKELAAIDGLTYNKNETANTIILEMTESAYSELKKIKTEEAKKKILAVTEDEKYYATEITYNDDFRNVVVKVDVEKLNGGKTSPYDDTVLKIVSYSMMYQIFTVEGQSVNIKLLSNADDTVLGEYKFPIEV